MKKYKNIEDYLKDNNLTREDLAIIVANSAVLLASECSRNFEGDPGLTETAMQPICYLNDIISKVQ